MKNWYKPGPVRGSHIEPDPRPQKPKRDWKTDSDVMDYQAKYIMLSLHPGTWHLYVLMTGNVSRVAYRAMATGQNANISLKTRYSIKIKGGIENGK